MLKWGFRCCSVTKSYPTLCDPMDCNTAPLSSTVSRSLLKFMSIESVMPSNHPSATLLLLLPWESFPMSQFSAICHQSTEALVSASVLPVNIQGWFPLGLTGLISLLSKGLSGVLSSTTVWKHQFFGAQPSLWSNSHMRVRRLLIQSDWCHYQKRKSGHARERTFLWLRIHAPTAGGTSWSLCREVLQAEQCYTSPPLKNKKERAPPGVDGHKGKTTRGHRGVLHISQGERPQETPTCWHIDLGLSQPTELWKNKLLTFKIPSLWYFVVAVPTGLYRYNR